MKSLYYRSEKISPASLMVLAVASMVVVVVVQKFPSRVSDDRREQMLAASQLTEDAFEDIRTHRQELGIRVNHGHDPCGSGMLGPSMSLVTSLPGHLDAKQTSVNPNFAAVAVHYLLESGARPGDRVAIGCTGSFPALNIAVLAAAETLEMETFLISSAASSQFGANHPRQMWPAMEKRLVDSGVLTSTSMAVSRGGFRDNAVGMTDNARRLLDEAIARGEQPVMDCDGLEQSIGNRLRLLANAGGAIEEFAAYVNVGGGSASVGGTQGNDQLGRGLILPEQFRKIEEPKDSVASNFLRRGVPVINMIEVVSLANQHGLPVAPTVAPVVGEGGIYEHARQRRSFALAGILFILASTSLLVRPPAFVADMVSRTKDPEDGADHGPRWMV